MSIQSPSASSVLRRSTAALSAGLLAAALTLGGAIAAHAAAPSLASNTSTVTGDGLLTLTAGGMTPGDALSFVIDSDTALETDPVDGGSQSADDNGDYTGDAWMTGLSLGTHTISVTDAAGSQAQTTVTVIAKPTAAVTPSSQAVSEYRANGVTVSFSGFEPGSTVILGFYHARNGGPVDSATANDAGEVTFRYVPEADSDLSNEGEYRMLAVNENFSIISEYADYAVTADPAPAPKESEKAQSTPAPAAPVAGPATPIARPATFAG